MRPKTFSKSKSNTSVKLNILNVNGLKKKLTDPDFINEHVDPNTLNCFIETFFSEEEKKPEMKNFTSYHSCRKLTNKNSKRASGGISIYIPNKFINVVEIKKVDMKIFYGLSLRDNKSKHRKGKIKKQNVFDKNCYDKRQELKRLGIKLSKFPDNDHLRKTFHHNKKEYKYLLKMKKREEKEKKLKKLDELKSSEIKERWKIIKSFSDENKDQNDPSEEISSESWINFYRKLGFNENHYEDTVNVQEPLDVKLTVHQKIEMNNYINNEISTEEVLKTANNLKSNKAVGIDNVSNEMLKVFTNLKIGSKIIKSMFNEVFGRYPEIWKEGMLKPIFKKGDKSQPTNYRGITLTSCLGKMFNQILNERLIHVFELYDIFPDNLMGFRQNMRTSNNVFILKTLIDKQFTKKDKLFCCFVDISKAFDRVWRKGLLYKLNNYGISGKMLETIKELYTNTRNRILLNNSMTEQFEINMGVKQGDPLSSLLFNIDMIDLCDRLRKNKTIDAPDIMNTKVPCLLWADDIVLMSKSEQGLKNSIRELEEYCKNWRMIINTDKTKIVIFNKTGKMIKNNGFEINKNSLKVTKSYKYLGFQLDNNGNFNGTVEDLANRAKRALYSIYKLSTINYISVETMINVFNATIKPILLYGSEIWGYHSKQNSQIEKIQLTFGKNILGVNRKSINLAILGELDLKPLKIDMKINSLKYFDYVKQNKNKLLTDTLQENILINSLWIQEINKTIDETNFDLNKLLDKTYNLDITVIKKITYKNNKIIKTHCKSGLIQNFNETWDEKTNNMNRLAFYKEIKTKPDIGKYLLHIESRTHRAAVTKLLISAHKLKIETERYSKNRKAQNERFCDFCNVDPKPIDDEIHFLYDCTSNKKLREEYFPKIGLKIDQNRSSTNREKIDLFKNILNSENKNMLTNLARFIYLSELERKKVKEN